MAGVAVGTTLGARALDVRSAQDVRRVVQGAYEPLVLALRRRMEPLKGWTQAQTRSLPTKLHTACCRMAANASAGSQKHVNFADMASAGDLALRSLEFQFATMSWCGQHLIFPRCTVMDL